MPSEIRVNQLNNRSGLSTVTLSDAGVSFTGVTTVGILSATGNSVLSGNVTVGSGSSITVGQTFIQNNSIGLGQTTTTGRNAGVGTATGSLIFNSDTSTVDVWTGSGWVAVGGGLSNFIQATGGTISDYSQGEKIYRSHIFTSSGTFTVSSAPWR